MGSQVSGRHCRGVTASLVKPRTNRIKQNGQLVDRKDYLGDDRLIGVRTLKVNYLNSFLRNHRTILERVRAHEYRVLGRCKFLNYLNSNMIPDTTGSVQYLVHNNTSGLLETCRCIFRLLVRVQCIVQCCHSCVNQCRCTWI